MPIDKPLPLEVLADALQDRIHKNGPAIKPGKSVLSDVPGGAWCPHTKMDYCCAPKNCGHLLCKQCGLSYDEGFDA